MDIRHNKDRKVRRTKPKSEDIYLRLLVKVSKHLSFISRILTVCANFMIFPSLRFCVKSIFGSVRSKPKLRPELRSILAEIDRPKLWPSLSNHRIGEKRHIWRISRNFSNFKRSFLRYNIGIILWHLISN